ncbi:SPFH domain-containing protein [Natrarchaeobius sp. A-rgal3]|uniref:SPFH domain-containing protein n=1 Tax=Natrarchaeobius versutus TaxID=1679078 RepID=UPI003510011E
MTIGLFVGAVVLVVTIVALVDAIEVVDQDDRKILFAFGEYRDTLEPGLNVTSPFVSWTESVPAGLQTAGVSLEDVETADSVLAAVAVRADVEIVDVEKAYTEVDDYQSSFVGLVRSMAKRELRRAETETVSDEPYEIERRIRDDLEETVDDWGLVVPAVELEAGPDAESPR